MSNTQNETIELKKLRCGDGYWYLATPYTQYPDGLQVAFIEACRCAGWLIKRGVRLFCPIAHTHPIAIAGMMELTNLDIWLPADKPLMDAAYGLIVVMMPTWAKSVGIHVEIDIFEEQNKPVEYMRWPR